MCFYESEEENVRKYWGRPGPFEPLRDEAER